MPGDCQVNNILNDKMRKTRIEINSGWSHKKFKTDFF